MSVSAPRFFTDHRRAWLEGRQEVLRHRLVRIIFLIYWLLIFEGAIRKWGFPQLRDVFFFIRVPITLVLYALAFSAGRWPRATWPLLGAYVFAIAGAILIPVQLLWGSYEFRYLLIAAYGWIHYFFYIPLAFIIAEQFREADLRALVRHTFSIAVLVMPLVIVQFYSPYNSVINQGSGLDEVTQFRNIGAALGYVRPNGFFTGTEGQAAFVVTTAAFVMFSWLMPVSARPTSSVLLILATVSVLVMVVLSQSRGLFFLLALLVLASLIAGIITGNARVMLRSALWPILLLGATAIAWPLVFPKAYEVFAFRWVAAQASESGTFQLGVFGRAFYGFYEIFYYLEDTPVIGYLIGLGGNAASQLEWVRFPAAAYNWNGYGLWAEGGWSRHIIELGPWLGIAFIGYRIALTIWLASLGARSARVARNPLPLLLFGAVGILILNGQITGNGAANGYAWMFLGFALAATKINLSHFAPASTHVA